MAKAQKLLGELRGPRLKPWVRCLRWKAMAKARELLGKLRDPRLKPWVYFLHRMAMTKALKDFGCSTLGSFLGRENTNPRLQPWVD